MELTEIRIEWNRWAQSLAARSQSAFDFLADVLEGDRPTDNKLCLSNDDAGSMEGGWDGLSTDRAFERAAGYFEAAFWFEREGEDDYRLERARVLGQSFRPQTRVPAPRELALPDVAKQGMFGAPAGPALAALGLGEAAGLAEGEAYLFKPEYGRLFMMISARGKPWAFARADALYRGLAARAGKRDPEPLAKPRGIRG